MFNHSQTSWASGAIRSDLFGTQANAGAEIFAKSAERIQNAVILPLGGIKRRGGFKYIARSNATSNSRLFYFERRNKTTNKVENYLVVFSDYKFEIFDVDGNSQVLVDDSLPYSAGELNDIDTAHTKESLYVTHGNHAPHRLWYDDTNNKWIFESLLIPGRIKNTEREENEYPIIPDLGTRRGLLNKLQDLGKFFVRNYEATRPGGDWQRSIYYNKAAGDLLFTDLNTYLDAIGQEVPEYDPTKPKVRRVEVWGKDKNGNEQGYPKLCLIHNNRLIFASTEKYPNGLWFSQNNTEDKEELFWDFGGLRSVSTGQNITVDISGIAHYMSIGQEKITALLSKKDLYVYTTHGIYSFGDISPGKLEAKPLSSKKINTKVQPIGFEYRNIYSSDDIIYYLTYDDRIKNYISTPISQNTYLVDDPKRMAMVQAKSNKEPDLLLILNNDNKLTVASITRDITQAGEVIVNAFTEWNTQGEFLDIVSDDTKLYGLIERDSKIYIEKYERDYSLDHSVKFEKTNFDKTFDFNARLDYLETQKVDIVADHMWYSNNHEVYKNPVSNKVVIDRFTDTEKQFVEVGHGYSFEIDGWIPRSIFANTISISEFTFSVVDSYSLSIQYGNNLKTKQIITKDFSADLDKLEKRPVISQYKVNVVGNDYQYRIFQEAPLDVKIIGINIVGKVT
ncbi:MAG: hypothetical protein OEZ01_00125 [Candidatus Heimdallarchaeota archaeon]|nr:hypothetical protein [Candidatus Heimdallarchaeota archaeon]